MATTAVRLHGAAAPGLPRKPGLRELLGLAWFDRLQPGFADVP